MSKAHNKLQPPPFYLQGEQSTSVWNQFIDDTEDASSMPDKPHPSDTFDLSRVTTDRDMFRGRRGRGRGGRRGKGKQYSGRKRKFDEVWMIQTKYGGTILVYVKFHLYYTVIALLC